MSMRITGLVIFLALLAGCKPAPEGPPGNFEEDVVTDGNETISCAVGGSADYSHACEVERAQDEGTLYLVVRHPDGAFRRFEVLQDGRGLAFADGADQGDIRIAEDSLEVAIGRDRYRFPATRKANVAQP